MRALLLWTLLAASACLVAAASALAGGDPLCLGAYGGGPAHPGPPLRFGIDPGLAGSAGGLQIPTVPDDPDRDLAAVRALHPQGRTVVVRLNRLFWSDGTAGIARFKAEAARYAQAGLDVEIQVRYHPPDGEAGDIAAWDRYVRRVVDQLGANPRVVAMTITNEVNVTFSPNTSDGAYARADDALISGIEAAHAEAERRHFTHLRFGFTYAYRFNPSTDAGLFSYLGAHGGAALRRALGFVGLDFYPGSIYPPAMLPGDTYSGALSQAAGVLRDCFAPLAHIGSRVPIWITENGVPTGLLSESAQAAALQQLVEAAHQYSGTFNITDYRWFNLRDSVALPAVGAVGPLFATDGLLRSDYTAKPSFATYRSLIARLGSTPVKPHARRRRRRASRHRG